MRNMHFKDFFKLPSEEEMFERLEKFNLVRCNYRDYSEDYLMHRYEELGLYNTVFRMNFNRVEYGFWIRRVNFYVSTRSIGTITEQVNIIDNFK